MNRRKFLKNAGVAAAASTVRPGVVLAGSPFSCEDPGPYYKNSLYHPVSSELNIPHRELRVSGRIPDELNGDLYINSANSKHSPLGVHHWFDGDGMIYHFKFRDGKVDFQNRWVRTRKYLAEAKKGRALRKGLAEGFGLTGKIDLFRSRYNCLDTGNTTVLGYGGELFANWYLGAGRPYRIDPKSLNTIADRFSVNGTTVKKMSAHPKWNPFTDELMFFSYDPTPNRFSERHAKLKISRWRKQKNILKSISIDLPGPRNIHDMGLALEQGDPSRGFLLIFDTPSRSYLGDLHNEPTRIGMLPLQDFRPEAIKWIEVKPGYILHVASSFIEQDRVFLQATQELSLGKLDDPRVPIIPNIREPDIENFRFKMHMKEWSLDYKSGLAEDFGTPFGDPSGFSNMTEFPTYDLNLEGLRRDYYVPQLAAESLVRLPAIYRYCHKGKQSEVYRVTSQEHSLGEPRFVASENKSSTQEGFLLIPEYTPETSRLLVFGVSEESSYLEATIDTNGYRLPVGFHNTWLPVTGQE